MGQILGQLLTDVQRAHYRRFTRCPTCVNWHTASPEYDWSRLAIIYPIIASDESIRRVPSLKLPISCLGNRDWWIWLSLRLLRICDWFIKHQSPAPPRGSARPRGLLWNFVGGRRSPRCLHRQCARLSALRADDNVVHYRFHFNSLWGITVLAM